MRSLAIFTLFDGNKKSFFLNDSLKMIPPHTAKRRIIFKSQQPSLDHLSAFYVPYSVPVNIFKMSPIEMELHQVLSRRI